MAYIYIFLNTENVKSFIYLRRMLVSPGFFIDYLPPASAKR